MKREQIIDWCKNRTPYSNEDAQTWQLRRELEADMIIDYFASHPEEQDKVKITKVVCPECKNEEGIKFNAYTKTHTCKCGKRWFAFQKEQDKEKTAEEILSIDDVETIAVILSQWLKSQIKQS